VPLHQPETLKDNPAFVDAVLAATHAVIRTSQEEKRKALRNAVVNSALAGAPEIAMQQMFIATLDRFTDWHLKVLHVARDEALVAKERGATVEPSLHSLLGRACPPLRGRQEFADVLWQDLYSAGLVNTPTMYNMIGTRRTSDFGDQFLAFVADPFHGAS
jgi:hypothetical protein